MIITAWLEGSRQPTWKQNRSTDGMGWDTQQPSMRLFWSRSRSGSRIGAHPDQRRQIWNGADGVTMLKFRPDAESNPINQSPRWCHDDPEPIHQDAESIAVRKDPMGAGDSSRSPPADSGSVPDSREPVPAPNRKGRSQPCWCGRERCARIDRRMVESGGVGRKLIARTNVGAPVTRCREGLWGIQ